MAKFDLIIQNNASKEFFTYSGLTDESVSHLYHEFGLELDVPDGEYTYVVFVDERDDVEYELKTPILSSILHTGDGDVLLRDIQPLIGLLRVGQTAVQENIYDKNEEQTIFFYDN